MSYGGPEGIRTLGLIVPSANPISSHWTSGKAWTGVDGCDFMIHKGESVPNIYGTRKEAIDYFGVECVVQIEIRPKQKKRGNGKI